MSNQSSDPANIPAPLQESLSRWNNEGGAEPCGPQVGAVSGEDPVSRPKMADAELGALHIRVIALENLVISLLAAASDRQLEQTRDMARYISPRPGFTHHPLTTHAAAHMIDLVERACRFRGAKPS